jgi:hypothetical protein
MTNVVFLLSRGAQGIRAISQTRSSYRCPRLDPSWAPPSIVRRLKIVGADTPRASWTVLVGGLVLWIGAILVLVAGGAHVSQRMSAPTTPDVTSHADRTRNPRRYE